MAENSGHIRDHTFDAGDIVTCLMLYVYSGCSYNSIPKVMEVIRMREGREGERIPSLETVRGWVAKAGLSVLRHKGKSMGESFALVMDESISAGGYRMLLGLGIPSENEGHAVSHSDVTVLDISVGRSFNAKDVSDMIGRTVAETGKPPRYALSDGGTNLVKGVGESGLRHHRDIGHMLATHLKKVYGGEPDFKELAAMVGRTKHWTLDGDLAPLKAPNQRAIARYMNVYDWIEWSGKVLEVHHRLTEKERFHLGFVQRHASLVEELSGVCRMLKSIMHIVKAGGLSFKTARECKRVMAEELRTNGVRRVVELTDMVTRYIDRECRLLESDKASHNISSDIIESVFGLYKGRRSVNKMHGITSLALTIPLFPYKADRQAWNHISLRHLYSNTTINDVRAWKKDNIPASPYSIRQEKLAS